jgi:hypothetical protein
MEQSELPARNAGQWGPLLLAPAGGRRLMGTG